MTAFIDLKPEVAEALRAGAPVLALESTIITHGMPWPKNREMAEEVERVVTQTGAVPATIAMLEGRVKVGLEATELDDLAGTAGTALKCSRRDIAALISQKSTAGTTVAATMIFAEKAGIRVFATGGIGGVHRGAENTMDISADLQELSATPVAVVCAGPKSILDTALTLEYLETKGVPVLGYQTDELPAFYCRQSGHRVDYRLDTPSEVAQVLNTHWSLGLRSGPVIANPISEAYALDNAEMEAVINFALKKAANMGVMGKDITPFLLAEVEQLTAGASLEANIELMISNARLGAEIACRLAELV